MTDNRLWSYDRTEGDLAVLVDDEGNRLCVPLSALPEQSREGMLFRPVGDTFVADAEAEAERRRRILELQNRLRCR